MVVHLFIHQIPEPFGQGALHYTRFPLFQGIIVPARGPSNFGWDPVFQPVDFKETYAEMSPDVKNTISHRYRALDKLKDHLVSLRNDDDCNPPDSKKNKLDN